MLRRLRRMEPFGLAVQADSVIRDGLFRLIFTCESSQPYASRNPAQVRFTEYDHVVEAVPSQSLPAGET